MTNLDDTIAKLRELLAKVLPGSWESNLYNNFLSLPALLDALDARAARIVELEQVLRDGKIDHDAYGYCEHMNGSPCSCGADDHNQRIDAVLAGRSK